MAVHRLVIAAVVVLFALPASAQSHKDVVESVKKDLVARGIDLAGPCGAFQITKRVAWMLRGEGVGLLAKNPGQNNCELRGVDVVVYRDGRIFDILEDSGRLNGPRWERAAGDGTAGWREPTDPGDISTPPPPSPPPPVPAAELQPLIDAIEELKIQVAAVQNQVNAHEGFHARLAELERQQMDDFNYLEGHIGQAASNLSKVILALQCKASVFGVPIHCEVK